MDDDVRIEKVGVTKVQVMWTCVRESDGRKAHHVATDEYAQQTTRDLAFDMTSKKPPPLPERLRSLVEADRRMKRGDLMLGNDEIDMLCAKCGRVRLHYFHTIKSMQGSPAEAERYHAYEPNLSPAVNYAMARFHTTDRLIRDVHIATLVEAAGLICGDCRVGGPWFGAWFDLVDKYWRVEHPGGTPTTSFPCAAEPIIKQLVKEWA